MRNWFSYRVRPRTLELWAPVVVVAVLSFAAAAVTWLLITRHGAPLERAERVAAMGELDTAELLYWEMLQREPGNLDILIQFLDTHAVLQHVSESHQSDPGNPLVKPSVTEAQIQKLLAGIVDQERAAIAWFAYASSVSAQVDPNPILTLADRLNPPRYANHLLARAALDAEDKAEAALRFEREGFAFPKEARRDLERALSIWVRHDAWGEVRRAAGDPRYDGVRDAWFRLQLAEQDRDWLAILIWLWPASFVNVQPWPVALAILAAALWFAIASRLGRIHDSISGRPGLYALSFVLGILSIYPTLILITLEESLLGLKEIGEPLPDAIYFIFGVGLREELSKLLLFLPLLPFLRRRASRIEAMTCGALVGLGFAAEENISYFHQLDAGVALARFLTANFLHMALTSIIALSVYDTVRGRNSGRDGFATTFPLAVVIHGAYDFFLSSPQFAELSFLSMVLFVVIARQFLRQLLIATSAREESGVLRLFVWSLSVLTGVSYVYATTLVGPMIALRLIALGVFGVAIMIYVFVHELT